LVMVGVREVVGGVVEKQNAIGETLEIG